MTGGLAFGMTPNSVKEYLIMSCIIALKSCPVPSCSLLGLAGGSFTVLVVTVFVTLIPKGRPCLRGRDL